MDVILYLPFLSRKNIQNLKNFALRKKIFRLFSSRFLLTVLESTKIKGGANMFGYSSDYALNKKDPDAIVCKGKNWGYSPLG